MKKKSLEAIAMREQLTTSEALRLIVWEAVRARGYGYDGRCAHESASEYGGLFQDRLRNE